MFTNNPDDQHILSTYYVTGTEKTSCICCLFLMKWTYVPHG